MVRFVDEAEIDARYWEKPYYLMPDGDEADEAYSIIRDALKQTRKVAIGQLIMHGRGHLVGIKALGKALTLSILRYGDEVRDAEPYFAQLNAKPEPEAVGLAKELIKRMSGKFEPEKMPDEYASAVRELVRAKIEQRAPEVQIAPEGKPKEQVINIMDALKASMQRQGQAKVRDVIRKRMGNPAPQEKSARPRPTKRPGNARRSLH
jgi:DNA end-binding protein Ku